MRLQASDGSGHQRSNLGPGEREEEGALLAAVQALRSLRGRYTGKRVTRVNPELRAYLRT